MTPRTEAKTLTLAHLALGSLLVLYAAARFLPLFANSFLMVAWDLSQDPVWSTIQHCWIWPHGGTCFGVPLSNFFGCYLTVYIVYQLFALDLRNHPILANPLPQSCWQLAVLFFVVCAAGNLLLLLGAPPRALAAVSDPTRTAWNIRAILGASALVSVFTMRPFALLASLRLADQDTEISSP